MSNDGFYSSDAWLDVRYQALKASNGSCKCCGTRATPDAPLHVDHIKPRSKHPEMALSLSNLQVLCRSCNMGKSNKDDTDWRWTASSELLWLEGLDPLTRAKLKQFNWLMLQGETKETRRYADKEYRRIWKNARAGKAFEE